MPGVIDRSFKRWLLVFGWCFGFLPLWEVIWQGALLFRATCDRVMISSLLYRFVIIFVQTANLWIAYYWSWKCLMSRTDNTLKFKQPSSQLDLICTMRQVRTVDLKRELFTFCRLRTYIHSIFFCLLCTHVPKICCHDQPFCIFSLFLTDIKASCVLMWLAFFFYRMN